MIDIFLNILKINIKMNLVANVNHASLNYNTNLIFIHVHLLICFLHINLF